MRTSNFKFEFVFVFQPFDIRIQASLIRRKWFCLESGALLLQRGTVWRLLGFLRAVNSSDARRVFAYPFPPLPAYPKYPKETFNSSYYRVVHGIPPQRSITLRLALCPWQAIKVTNLGGSDTEQTSVDGNRAWHGLTSWLIALSIDCFLACVLWPSSRPTVQTSNANCLSFSSSQQIYKRSSNLIRILEVFNSKLEITNLTSLVYILSLNYFSFKAITGCPLDSSSSRTARHHTVHNAAQCTELAAGQLSRYHQKRPMASKFAQYKPNARIGCNVGDLPQA